MRGLTTKRLQLEPLDVQHAGPLYLGLSDLRIYDWIEEEPPASVVALRQRYEKLATRKSPSGDEIWLNWALRLRNQEQYLGYVQATLRGKTASIAYVLFPQFWDQGYGSEAVAVMLRELKRTYQISIVRGVIDVRNHRSIRLLTRLGFERGRGAVNTSTKDPNEAVYSLDLTR